MGRNSSTTSRENGKITPSIPLTQTSEGVALSVLVVPNASRLEIVGVHDDSLRIRVTAPPEAGKANKQVAGMLERTFGVRRARLLAGATGRRKRFLLEGAELRSVDQALGGL